MTRRGKRPFQVEGLTDARGMQALNLTKTNWAGGGGEARWEGRDETEKMP